MINYQAQNISAEAEKPDLETPPLFILKNVRQVKGDQLVLDGIDLEIAAGKLTTIVGPSGAGKTSLLRLLNRLDDPAEGEIFYDKRPLPEIPVQNLRREVGFVFQTPVMFPGTVTDNLQKAVGFGGKMISAADSLLLIEEALTLTEIHPLLAERDGISLSVGQKQRVNIARALMTSPKVLLMDEPTSALDPETADKLMETVRQHLVKEKGLTVVMITHRLSEARRASDITIFMEAGRIIEIGDTAHIFENSENSRIRQFMANGK